MDNWVTILIAVLGSGALSALVTGIFAERSIRKKKELGVQAGVRNLLYNDVKRTGRKYIERGSVSFEELEDLKRTHRIYHDDLNGNGFLDTIMNDVEDLPHIG